MNKILRLIHKKSSLSYRICAVLLACAMLWSASPTVTGLTPSQLYGVKNHPFYDPTQVCDSGTLGFSDDPGSTTGIWNSGLQPPYILEQFAIETLKDIAQKKGVDPKDTVTQEHVIALLAFMYGEGGDIGNRFLFNPLNTGLNAPDLIAGDNSPSGLQSFKSFDAGVEATARTMVGRNQSRLAAALIKPGSTAKQFMQALTYFNRYPGNKLWAEASLPPNDDSYYAQRLQLVQQVRNSYADIAGLVIGTPEKEAIKNITEKSKLQFHPSTDKGDSKDSATSEGSADGCIPGTAGIVAGNISQTAINFSWPEPWSRRDAEPGRSSPLTPKKEYADALVKYNPAGKSSSSANGADCGVFVSTVMRASGADPEYPASGTAVQLDYVKSHTKKYIVTPGIKSTVSLLPGDILIVTGSPGHTLIFVGKQPNGNDQASASLGSRMPNLGSSAWNLTQDSRGPYFRVRLR